MDGATPVRVLEIKSRLDWEGASYDLTHRIEIRDITEEVDEDARGQTAATVTLPGPADTKAILNELYALAAAAKGMLIAAREAVSARERAEDLSGAEGALDTLIGYLYT